MRFLKTARSVGRASTQTTETKNLKQSLRLQRRLLSGLRETVRSFVCMTIKNDSAGARAPILDPHIATLVFIKKGPAKISEIGRQLQRSKPNMTLIVNKLEHNGYIKKIPDPIDRRVIRISITSTGMKFVNTHREEMSRRIINHLSLLSLTERGQFADSLETIARLLKKLNFG